MSAPAAPVPTIRRIRGRRIGMVGNEIGKGMQLRWAYRATVLPELFGAVAMYLMFQYFIGDGRIIDELIRDTAPAMFAFVVGYGALMRLVAGLLEERNAGTLEQTHLSPLPVWQLALSRLAVVLAESVLIGAAATAGVLAAFGVRYPLVPQALVPVGLMLAGVAGFILLIGAASFTYPGIGALVHIIQMLIISVNGTIAPVELYPHGLEVAAKLVPTTLGVAATRRILIDGDSLAQMWADGTLGWLILHTLTLVAAGWTAYRWQVRRALRDGKLGPT